MTGADEGFQLIVVFNFRFTIGSRKLAIENSIRELPMRRLVLMMLLIVTLAGVAFAQTSPDPFLMAEINKIRTVDNHTHVPKIVGPGEKDDEYDALPCGGYLEPNDDPATARPDNPLFLEAWQKLYGYKYNDKSAEHVRELLETKQRVAREQGDNFPAWVLDQLGTQYMLANRVAMGRGLDPRRFLWVPFDDALMLPLNGQAMTDTPDRKFFYQREAMLQERYRRESSVTALPATVDEYVIKVIVPTLERQKKAGAVAVKFEAAYLRSLNFAEPQEDEARRVYARYVKEGVPSKPDYIKVQDFLFRTIAREAGRLGLAVHIHTGAGCGGYFNVSGSNPSLLDSVLNDAALRKTNFVLVHGGAGPYTKVTSFLFSKPNVYADFSEQDWMLSPHGLSIVLRDWLGWYPEKILFGTDLFPGTPEINWEEIGYMTSTTGRVALALALTGMVSDGEITRERAVEMARMVLRENAIKLYGLKP
jgi:predicted TIM-barrel fold metal-dependent hydrolase